jgi:alkyl hydroperoxide reductase subunit AhpC
VELQGRYDDIRKQGLGLIAISYDSPETLKKFADSRGISFPLISDPGSAIIKRFGILNEQQEPGTRSYGIPHPGTFIVDRNGVVTARFFEDAYQERYTAAAILAAQGTNPGGASITADQSPEYERLDLGFGGRSWRTPIDRRHRDSTSHNARVRAGEA